MHPIHARTAAFCARFGLRLPILQAPMAGANPPTLAAAVANAGGLGALGALLHAPDALRDWCAAVRGGSNGAFQVNLWIPDPPPLRDAAQEARVRDRLGTLGPAVPEAGPGPFTQDFAAQCAAVLEAAPPVVSSIMGVYPPEFVAALKARGIAWFANVTSVEEARAAAAAGADAVVAQGVEAGGHRGSFDPLTAEATAATGLFALLPQVVDAVVPLPVVATGGLMDGRGVAAALVLGASAAQLGTAFLRCPEAAIAPAWADSLATARPEDTVLTRAFSGRLGRGLRNRVTEAFEDLAPSPYPLQRALTAGVRDAATKAGDATRMQAWAGQGAGLARAEPAGEVVRRVWAEAEALLPA